MVDRIGQQLGNYRLLSLLGIGGFAEVYLGEHIYLESQAAIKILRTILSDEHNTAFLTEARRLVLLRHPHIVRLLDFGIEENVPFLVMEYASHGSLGVRHPKGTQVPLETVLSYVKQVAEALQYVHEQKLVHRDIKPENLLLGPNQEILLSDLGIAAVAHTTGSIVKQGQAGTPAYMAPEQYLQMPRPASDQYALAVLVYTWLCGEHPFHGTEWSIAYQHMYTPPPPLREKIPSISPAIEEIVLKALSKEPYQRFVSVQDFATAFDQACQVTLQNPSSFTIAFPPQISSIYLRTDTLSKNTSLPESVLDSDSSPYKASLPTPFVPLVRQHPADVIAQPSQVSQRNVDSSSHNWSLIDLATLHTQAQLPESLPHFSQSLQYGSQPPHAFQPLSTSILSHQASAKSSWSRIGMIVLLLMLIISAGGVATYLIFGLAHPAPGKGSTSLGQGLGTGTSSSPTMPLSSPTVSPVRLGWPVIAQYSPTEVANGSTTYTLSAYAVDQSIDPGHGNPVHASSITFKLWLVQRFPTGSTFVLTVKDLQNVNTIHNPLTGSVQGQPYPEIQGLKFDSGTPQTRLSDEKGRVIWKYQVSSSITLGDYNLVLLTDWNGKYYNWDWANIIITR